MYSEERRIPRQEKMGLILLDSHFDVCLLSRHSLDAKGGWKHRSWGAHLLDEWVTELDNSGAFVNLAGRSVNYIKSSHSDDVIFRSGVAMT